MSVVQIVLTCPDCGNSNWKTSNDFEFTCVQCGAFALPEAMCSAIKDADETDWFGMVCWCEDDLKNALEVQNYPVTENNVAKLRHMCEHHSFEDCMIERGWDHIYTLIGQGDGWDE